MGESVDILTIEVGSTITKANGFRFLPEGGFSHDAQGFAKTSVLAGDVGIGVAEAIADLESALGAPVGKPETFVNSSAAGGLRMTVHGLTYSMTARAAHEASLGAGAIVKKVTAGALEDYELEELRGINPNIILIAGGVEFGEKATVLRNAERIAALGLPAPVVYAGNSALHRPIQKLFHDAGIEVLIAENVFPDVDVLNIEPLRRLIHEVFSKHIVHAPGMARFEGMSPWGILPTPGAVLRGAELFAEAMGDCLVFDVGGATTDVHSVTDGDPEYQSKAVEPEPRAKRTVEGDLGVFVNAANIVHVTGDQAWGDRMGDLKAMPATERERELTRWLCARAVDIGARRHAGKVSDLYTPTGKRQIVKGKDLSAIKWVVATGGALTRVAGAADCLRSICTGPKKHLLPPPEARILIDKEYRFSALGTISQAYPADVKQTFEAWVRGEFPA
ncbi:MAG: glutamate mutase L [Spirochaetes bacterium]|nr:glutamate mutase L [Spirochaetota bacterium]MBU1080428.1 glutamate mutase L [Spirochaetota bacterium]